MLSCDVFVKSHNRAIADLVQTVPSYSELETKVLQLEIAVYNLAMLVAPCYLAGTTTDEKFIMLCYEVFFFFFSPHYPFESGKNDGPWKAM